MASEDRRKGRRLEGTGQKKKPFEPPKLYVYGDIATVTRAVVKTGAADAATMNPSKS